MRGVKREVIEGENKCLQEEEESVSIGELIWSPFKEKPEGLVTSLVVDEGQRRTRGPFLGINAEVFGQCTATTIQNNSLEVYNMINSP